jgi:hypothetical protein
MLLTNMLAVVFAIVGGAGFGGSPAAAQMSPADVGYVEAVSGGSLLSLARLLLWWMFSTSSAIGPSSICCPIASFGSAITALGGF